MEWIRFAITAFLLLAACFSFIAEVFGLYRFGFVMNRIHAAGIGDTLGLFCVVLASMVSSGFRFVTLKYLLLIFFLWFTSPVSTHFLGQVEYYTNPNLRDFVKGDFSNVRETEGTSHEAVSSETAAAGAENGKGGGLSDGTH